MHFARYDHSSVKLSDGRILIFDIKIKDSEIYDPKINKFILSKNSPNFKYYNQANTCVLSDGRVFIANGLQKNDKAEIFDPKTNEFKILDITLTNDSKEYYYLYKIIILKNDKIVIFENDKDDFNNVKILDLKTNKIKIIGHMNLK